jgi:RNA polymerase primary sigma factor
VTSEGTRSYYDDADAFVQRYVKTHACDPLPWVEQLALLRLYQKDKDQKALRKLVKSHQRNVVKEARKYLNRGLSLADLIQEANVGLLKAIQKFDESKGTQLSTVAGWWMRDSLQTAIHYKSSKPKLSSISQTIQKEWNRVRVEDGRYASAKEISQTTGISEEKIKRNRILMCDLISLDDNNPALDSGSRLDTLSDDYSMSVESQVEQRMDLAELERLLENLSAGDADFVKRKFGLYDGYPRTRSEAAEMYSMEYTEQEIGRWEHDIMDYLRALKNTDRLNQARGKRVYGDNTDCKGRIHIQAEAGTRSREETDQEEDSGYTIAERDMAT